ncbi:MAG: M48 family metallopeptidase [Cyanobacteria bacterium J06573_2]
MNFFKHQDKARQNTQLLFGLFALYILTMIFVIYNFVMLVLIFSYSTHNTDVTTFIWWNPTVFSRVSLVTIGFITLASCYKMISLRRGGSVIAKDLGGRLILAETDSEQEQQLLNIVDEMAIASGIPVPKVYLLYREPSINAFAAGFSLNDAVIGVTRGSIEQLNRDELQTVIAHEFSHILNGDIRINSLLIGLLHGILLIFITGKVITHIRFNGEEDCSLWPFGFMLMAIGGIGLIFGRSIQAAVSRQREFLADAYAVQFTRNPDAISGALQKIQQMDSRLLTPKAEAVSHIFFGNAVSIFFFKEQFATHPSVPIRIRRVNGTKVKVKKTSASSRNSLKKDSNNSNDPTSKPEKIINKIGTVTPNNFDFTQQLLAELPEYLKLGIRQTKTAQEILFALALENQDSQIQEKQLTWLRQTQPEEVVSSSIKFNQEIAELDSNIYLPLIDLTIPALKQLSPKECQRVCKCVKGLALAKGQASVRDFAINLILWHRLQPILEPDYKITIKLNSIAEIWSDCLLVLSAIVQIGENNPDSAAYAFSSGVFQLSGAAQQEKPKAPLKCSFSQLKKSIENLRQATPKLKQTVVEACAYTVLINNKITDQEQDLLRAIAMTLDCPIPPFLNSKRSN